MTANPLSELASIYSMVGELQPGDPRAIGPYRLVGRLGEGGMGQVFLGLSPGGRPAAVKAIRAELASDPQFRTRFGQEVAAARRVSGVFTAMVVGADADGPVPWLATAYVAGPSLAEAVDGDGPLPEESLLALAAGLAESLVAIHAAGVVHRDLKPSNVLLAEDGPRVIDFGISHAAESSALTQTGVVFGSPRFMSPEQAVGAEVGPPGDIFSLGAVLAFAATGHGPFGSGTMASLLYRVVHETPDLDGVPATVRPLVEHCLAKDPAQRPTAAGVLAAVGELQAAGDWLPPTALDLKFFPAVGSLPPATLDPRLPPAADPHAITAVDGQRVPIAALLSWEENPPPPGAGGPPGDGGRPRRRLWWPLVLASGIGGLVAVSAVTFALTAATGHPPAPARSQPAAQVAPAASAAHPATGGPTSPAASHRPPASASASSPAPASMPPTTPMPMAPTAMVSSTPASPTQMVRPSSSTPSSTPPSSSAPPSPSPSSAPPTSPPPSTSAPTSPPPSTSPSTSPSATPTAPPSASATSSGA